MSRSGSLQQALGDTEVRVRAIKPNGDCFYEAISEAFTMMTEDVRQCEKIVGEEEDSQAMALRRTAAASVDEETFSKFSMCHQAGLPDFHFMKRIRSVEDLRQRLLVSGVGAGAGHCLWANEYEMGVVSSALGVVLLIIDQQARLETSRYVKLGGEEGEGEVGDQRFIILQRSRREHYNLVYTQADQQLGVFSREQLSQTVKTLWKIED